jgi:homoserine dehydrogenase
VPERRRPHGGAPVGVALLGCGVIGSSVLRLLASHAEDFERRVGVPLEVRKVLVRDPSRQRDAGVPTARLCTDPEEVFGDPEIELAVELMGGLDPAGAYVERALESGRSVVTANKALLAARGPELFERAARAKVDLAFEAAVGGGIPVVRSLRDAFASDRVTEIVGILNGTSNYILTRMTDEGASFDDALAEAQAKGYAEADPTLDVEGHDAAQKLVVLAMLAFGATPPEPGRMLIEGIRGLDRVDVAQAARFGFVPKHLVIGRDRGEAIELRAHTSLVKKSSVLANVSGVLNAVRLEGEAVGPCLLSGRGAGGLPTAVSVVADVLDAARALVAGVPGLASSGRPLAARALVPIADLRSRYYVRLRVDDTPGVLARIASAMGERGVSVAELVQTPLEGGRAEIVMLTHEAREGDLRGAFGALAGEAWLATTPVVLRIEGH